MKIRPKVPYEEKPPRGMWYESTSTALPFVARWRTAGRKSSRSFMTARLRAEFADGWLKRRLEHGREASAVPQRQVEIWREFGRLTGGRDPLEVAREYLRMRNGGAGATLAQAIERYTAVIATQARARDSITHRDLHFRRLQAALGNPDLADVTPDQLRRWIDHLADPETGRPMSPKSKAHHRSTISRLFSHAVAERWITVNPCDAVPVPEGDIADHVNILSIDQAARLFDANRRVDCIGRLALSTDVLN